MSGQIQELQAKIGDNARGKGFWDAHEDMPSDFGAAWIKLALVGTEVAEAMESLREMNPSGPGISTQTQEGADYHPGVKPEGLASEMADIIIRVLDMAEWLQVDMGAVIEAKMAYNDQREAMHGRSA